MVWGSTGEGLGWYGVAQGGGWGGWSGTQRETEVEE